MILIIQYHFYQVLNRKSCTFFLIVGSMSSTGSNLNIILEFQIDLLMYMNTKQFNTTYPNINIEM